MTVFKYDSDVMCDKSYHIDNILIIESWSIIDGYPNFSINVSYNEKTNGKLFIFNSNNNNQ